MRGPRRRRRASIAACLAAGALALSACGTALDASRPHVFDQAGGALQAPPTYATQDPHTTATTPPATHPATHPPTHPPVAAAPHPPLAQPLGTVGSAPGHPVPLPGGAIALTFDDGPNPQYTPQVLAILARYHAHATFFDIGIHAQAYQSLVRAEYAAGNGVGSHSWTHPDLTKLPAGQVAYQIAQTATVLRAETGHPITCMRPPYDAFNPTVQALTAQYHEALMLYDVDPKDWQQPGVSAIVSRVLASAHPGAVVDMHDAGGDRSQTLAALPLILQGLAARHLQTVPICRG